MEEASVFVSMLSVVASLSSAECDELADEVDETLRCPMGRVPAMEGASYDNGFVVDTKATGEEI